MAEKTKDEQEKLVKQYEELIEEKKHGCAPEEEDCNDENQSGNGTANGDGDGDGDGKDSGESSQPKALMNPTVPGTIIWLRPANKLAIMYGGDNKDLRREGVQGSQEEEKQRREEIGEEAFLNEESAAQQFDPRVVPADAATLCTLRLAQQSMQDHYLGSYRCGLGMPVRMVMQTQPCDDKEESNDESGDKSGGGQGSGQEQGQGSS